MHTVFSDLTAQVRDIDQPRIGGFVSGVLGLSLTVRGLERAMGVGERCLVHGRRGPVLAEAVGMDAAGTRVLPFGSWDGVAPGDAVTICAAGGEIRPCDAWIGRVTDALGRPLDGQGPLLPGTVARRIKAPPPPAFERRRVGARLETGIRVFDVFTPLCRGQRMGVFAGSGVGKSTMMAMLARRAEAEVIVVGLVGERGREVQDFIQDDLGPEGLARSVLVVSTGDEPPLMRRQAAWTASAVAEHFRDQGRQVLLLIDSVTRFAMAQREIGLAGGEPPTSRGYPPTVFAELPQLMERAGPGREGQGDITALYTVLVDGDDMNEPIADAVRGIMDGHVVLTRQIAERGRFPALDVQRSISRMLPDCHTPAEYAVMTAARRAMGRYSDMEELIRIGAYRAGTDPEVDAAARFATAAEAFLSQNKRDASTTDAAFAGIYSLLGEAGVKVVIPKDTPEVMRGA